MPLGRKATATADPVEEKAALIAGLSKAIKELQLQFYHSGQDQVTLPTTAVLTLCAEIDAVLRHGLLKDGGFYKYVRLFTPKVVQDEVEKDKRVKTGIGRGRLWIRIALNESASTLEAYLRMFGEDTTHKPKFYSPDALINDSEQLSVAMMLLAGLDFLSFDVHFDASMLDPSSGGRVGFVPRSSSGASAPTVTAVQSRASEAARAAAAAGNGTTPAATIAPSAAGASGVSSSSSSFPAAVVSPDGSSAAAGGGGGGASSTLHTFGDAIAVDSLTAAPEDDLLHSHVAVKPKKKGKKKKKRNKPRDAADGAAVAAAAAVLAGDPAAEMLAPFTDEHGGAGRATVDVDAGAAAASREHVLSSTDSMLSPVSPAEGDMHDKVDPPSAHAAVPTSPARDGHDTANEPDPSDYVGWKRGNGSGPDLLPWGGERVEPEALQASAQTRDTPPLPNTSTHFITDLGRVIVERPEGYGNPAEVSDPSMVDAGYGNPSGSNTEAPATPAHDRHARGGADSGGGGGADSGGADAAMMTPLGAASRSGDGGGGAVSGSPLSSPSLLPPSSPPGAPVPTGCGADVDVAADENAYLMLKLQVFQSDDEEPVKISKMAMLRGNSEHVVHVLVTTVAVYVLDPPSGGADASYETYGAFGIRDIKEARSTHGGQGLVLSARGHRGDISFHFLTGDADVTDAVIAAIARVVSDAGEPAIVCDPADDVRWDLAVNQLVGAQQDEVANVSCHFAYIEVSAAVFAKVDVYSGLLELKESGLFSSTWRSQYFVLQGHTFAYFNERPTANQASAKPKAVWSIEAADFFCRKVDDTEREDCLEIGNAASSITVAGPPHDLKVWASYLAGHEPVVIGTNEPVDHNLSEGCSWLLAAAVLSDSHMYICRPDLARCTLKLLFAEPIEAVTALRSSPATRTSVTVEFDADDGSTRNRQLLMKTRPAALRFADAIGASWKELYQVDLERTLL
eukprot:m.32284 g.32284  ORF g.32284 m.32284 type:complete len:964 (+) comp4880_c0_seq1:111-3002(+)